MFVLLLKRHTGSDTEHHGARAERRNSSITSRSTPVRHFFLRFQSDLRPGPPVMYRAACREAQRDFAQRLPTSHQKKGSARMSETLSSERNPPSCWPILTNEGPIESASFHLFRPQLSITIGFDAKAVQANAQGKSRVPCDCTRCYVRPSTWPPFSL